MRINVLVCMYTCVCRYANESQKNHDSDVCRTIISNKVYFSMLLIVASLRYIHYIILWKNISTSFSKTSTSAVTSLLVPVPVICPIDEHMTVVERIGMFMNHFKAPVMYNNHSNQ